MQDVQKAVGNRIRNYRISAQISQENLAGKAGVHPTYIGQIERGEKNITLKSLSKISSALQISLSSLLDGIDELSSTQSTENYPLLCSNLVEQQSLARQKELYAILKSVTDYAND